MSDETEEMEYDDADCIDGRGDWWPEHEYSMYDNSTCRHCGAEKPWDDDDAPE